MKRTLLLWLLLIWSLTLVGCNSTSNVENENDFTPPEMNGQQPPEKPDWEWWPWGMPGWHWWSQKDITYNWANVISSSTTASNETYTSSNSSENALLIEGWESILDNITVEKTWDSDEWDSADFYWTNAWILAKAWEVTITNSNITTNATHGNAVYAYWEWSIIISDSTITTKKDT